jgi:hypothetical protein
MVFERFDVDRTLRPNKEKIIKARKVDSSMSFFEYLNPSNFNSSVIPLFKRKNETSQKKVTKILFDFDQVSS